MGNEDGQKAGPDFLLTARTVFIVISALALGGLIVSYGNGLFGWQEAGFRTPVALAMITEAGAVILLATALALEHRTVQRSRG